jgi:hypothetical protein
MVNWQVTATTIRCAAVGEDVTLMVYKDWTVKCTGFMKYGEPGKKNKGRQGGWCGGLQCRQVMQYREKLQTEEAKASGNQ